MDWQLLLQETGRTILVFVVLLIFTRFLGKTQVGQLTFYEYVSGITIGSIAGNILATAEQEQFYYHFYDLTLFVVLTYCIARLTLKSRPLRKLIEGSPVLVIKDGQILRENMRGMNYDLDELNAQLRENGVIDIKEVHYAVLENNGTMTVVKKSAYQPVTRADLAINASEPKYPVELVMDGEIITENLTEKYSQEWLDQELQKSGYSDVTTVMYAIVDSNGKFFACKKTDENTNMGQGV